MPCHYRIFARENLVAKSFCGRVTTECVLKMLDEIESDPNYVDGMNEFNDLSAVQDIAVSATDISNFAELYRGLSARYRRPAKKAILAPFGPGRAAAFGFSSMMEGNSVLEVGVFEELWEAAAFLGISEHERFCQSLVTDIKIN